MSPNVQVERTNTLDYSLCKQISNITEDESKLEFRAPESIWHNATCWCVIASIWEQVVGCFFLRKYWENPTHPDTKYQKRAVYKWNHIYERATLWVHPDYRSRGKYHSLQLSANIKKLLEEKASVAKMMLVSISSNPSVLKRNSAAWMHKIERVELQEDYPLLREILLEDDLDEKHGYWFLVSRQLKTLMDKTV